MTRGEYIRLKAQRAVLSEIALVYHGLTIDNIIQQMDSILNEVEHNGKM